MRKIIFRGKRIDGCGWAYGYYLECNGTCILDEDEMFFGYDGVDGLYNVDPSTIGQYTGLKDRNGVRIFEGDIVKAVDLNDPDFVGKVDYNYSAWCVYGYNWSDTLHFANELHKLVVIGNIHDNPELLEVQDD